MNTNTQSYFSACADHVRDLVPELCGYTCERVPIWYFESLYRSGYSVQRAAQVLASAVSS